MRTIVRIILGAIFMLSSIAKLSSLESFELYIFSFGFATFDICSLVARSVVIMEFLLGSFLVFNLLLQRYMRTLQALRVEDGRNHKEA